MVSVAAPQIATEPSVEKEYAAVVLDGMETQHLAGALRWFAADPAFFDVGENFYRVVLKAAKLRSEVNNSL